MMEFFRTFRLRLVAALGASLIAGSGAAQAQGWGFFDFFGRAQRPVQPVAPRFSKPRLHVIPRAAPLYSGATGSKAAVRKPGEPEPAHGVVVFGDNYAQPLANGLDEALSNRPGVAVLHKARDGSGLTRESSYDWPKAIHDFLSAKPAGAAKIDAAVILIGTNDVHSISEGGKTYLYDTDEWSAVYTRRVAAISDAFAAKKIPLVWVGIPIAVDESVADDMAALNEIFRDTVTKHGAVFVDTWEAFANADGDFAATGPDVNGQIVRLRSADGLRFTKAGAGKLAHFAEADIRRILNQVPDLTQPAALSALPGNATVAAPAKAPVKPEAGPVIVLTASPTAENGHLDTPSGSVPAAHPDPSVDDALIKGQPQTSHPGRADDASWPPK